MEVVLPHLYEYLLLPGVSPWLFGSLWTVPGLTGPEVCKENTRVSPKLTDETRLYDPAFLLEEVVTFVVVLTLLGRFDTR